MSPHLLLLLFHGYSFYREGVKPGSLVTLNQHLKKTSGHAATQGITFDFGSLSVGPGSEYCAMYGNEWCSGQSRWF